MGAELGVWTGRTGRVRVWGLNWAAGLDILGVLGVWVLNWGLNWGSGLGELVLWVLNWVAGLRELGGLGVWGLD